MRQRRFRLVALSYRIFCEALPGKFQIVDIGRYGNNEDHGVRINYPVADVKQFRIKTWFIVVGGSGRITEEEIKVLRLVMLGAKGLFD